MLHSKQLLPICVLQRTDKMRAYSSLPGQVTLLHQKSEEKRIKNLSFALIFFLLCLEDSLPREAGCFYQLPKILLVYSLYMCPPGLPSGERHQISYILSVSNMDPSRYSSRSSNLSLLTIIMKALSALN